MLTFREVKESQSSKWNTLLKHKYILTELKIHVNHLSYCANSAVSFFFHYYIYMFNTVGFKTQEQQDASQ